MSLNQDERSSPLEVEVRRSDEEIVVALRGELDLASEPDAQGAIDDAFAADSDRIVIDLSQLEFIDSAGMRLLMLAMNRSGTESTTLEFVRGTPAVMKSLELTGLAEQLPFAR